MTQISVFDAKNQLSALLDQVERGEGEITITRRGKPVAKLVAAASPTLGLADEIRALRQRIASHSPPFSIDEIIQLRDDGRR